MADITITAAADVSRATSGIDRLRTKVSGLASGARSSFGGLRDVIGGNLIADAVKEVAGRVVDLAKEVNDAGSNLQQSTGAMQAVFTRDFGRMAKAARRAAVDVGLSRTEYQELSTLIGAGLKNQGIKDFAGQTQKVVKLGADLSAQYGGSTKEAVEAIGSLMRGETDPIERYGVSINQTAVAALLAARGQDKLKGAALQQASAQARLSLLFKQTKDAAGAFGRESDTFAHKQQVNAARIADLKAKLGTALLPISTALQEALGTKVLPAVLKIVNAISARLPAAIAAGKAALADIVAFLGPIAAKIRAALASLGQPGSTGALSTYLSGVKSVIAAVLPIVRQVVTAVLSVVAQMAPTIRAIVHDVGEALSGVASILSSVWKRFGPIVLPILKGTVAAVIGIVGGLVKVIAGLIKTFAALLKGDWRGAWAGVKQILAGAAQAVLALARGLVNSLIRQFGVTPGQLAAIWGRAKSATVSAWASLKAAVVAKVNEVVSFVRGIPGRILGALGSLGSLLYNAGSNLIQGFVNGIAGAIGSVIAKAREVASAAVAAAKDALGIRSPSRVFKSIGAQVLAGLTDGLDPRVAAAAGAAAAGGLVRGFARPQLTAGIRLDPQQIAPGAGRLGGNTYNIDVKVERGASLVEVGREIVDAIREFERAGGRR